MSAVTGFIAAAALAFTPIEVDGLFVDGFAGGGGASTGIEQAIGRSVDIAVTYTTAEQIRDRIAELHVAERMKEAA